MAQTAEEKKQRNKIWRMKNKEHLKAYNSKYHKAHPEIRVKSRNRWKKSGLGPVTIKRYRQTLKADVIEMYGGKCAGCGFDDIAGLSIDHINGDGHIERQALWGYKLYVRLRRGPMRKDLRVLCMTCQFMSNAYGSNIENWPGQQERQKQRRQKQVVKTVLSWAAGGPAISPDDYAAGLAQA